VYQKLAEQVDPAGNAHLAPGEEAVDPLRGWMKARPRRPTPAMWRSIGVPSLWNPTLSYSTESLRSEAVALRRERTSPGGEREREREGVSVQSSQLQSTIDSQTVKTLTCEPLL
jgi:hypothetical protein